MIVFSLCLPLALPDSLSLSLCLPPSLSPSLPPSLPPSLSSSGHTNTENQSSTRVLQTRDTYIYIIIYLDAHRVPSIMGLKILSSSSGLSPRRKHRLFPCGFTFAVTTAASPSLVLADGPPPAFDAEALLSVVLADGGASAWEAVALLSLVLADAAWMQRLLRRLCWHMEAPPHSMH